MLPFTRHLVVHRLLLALPVLLGCALAANAQTGSGSLNDTLTTGREEAPMEAPPTMAMNWNQFRTKWFTLNIGAALILDHTVAEQDEASIAQVGAIGPATEFRGERLIFSGNLLIAERPWRYMISANYNGLDAVPGTKTLSLIDANLEIPFGNKGGWITVGKQKEGVGHEYILPGTQSMFTERGSGAPVFVRQRNIGLRYSNSIMDHRLTWTLGLFNNWLETGKSFAANGSQVTARVTGLPHYTSDRDLMHVGLAYRYTDATEGALQYKGRPESNTAPFFVSTGSFAAAAANTLLLEWIGVRGPVSVLGEYMHCTVASSATGDPTFSYWQLGGSWFITGENRRYNKQAGNMGKLIPKKNFRIRDGSGLGAFEVGARYTRSDLTDKSLSGGELGRATGAFSWYPNAHFRFEVNYGKALLDRKGLSGQTDFWQFRAQFEL